MISLAGGLRRRQRGAFKAAAASGPAFRAASSTTTIIASGGFILTAPTGTIAGDVLIVQFYDVIDSKSGVVGTAPVGWTQQGSGDATAPHIVWRTFTRVATGADAFVWTGGSNWTAPLIAAMVAISGGTAVDVVGARTLVATASSVTTTTAPTLLVGLWTTQAHSTAAPASMTSRASLTNIGGPSLVIATQSLAASGATGTRVSPTVDARLRFSQLIAVK
jgi:hypothetical protein